MRLLADENIPRSIVVWLRTAGHDVLLASESGLGQSDSHWLDLAANEQRVILTSDKDFGELIFRDRLASFGIILLRLDDLPVPQWVTRLQETWSVIEAGHLGRFIVISAKRVRVRLIA